MSISASAKKRGRPVTTGTGKTIGVRLQPDLLSALDSLIDEAADPKPSRPDVIRIAFRDWLIGQGRLRHRKDPEGAN